MIGPRRGFTLLELMVAIMIFSLVITAIYFTLTAGVESFHQGERSMEMYQGARIGLNRFGKDLRRAVSPRSPWSNLAEDERRGRTDPMLDPSHYADDEYLGPEPKENDIRFTGDSKQVSFVVQKVTPGAEPAFDLLEIQYSVDPEKELLLCRTTDSVLLKRMMDWRAFHTFNETEFRLSHAGRSTFEERQEEIAGNIADLELEYFDGKEWRDWWDSNEIIVKESYEDTWRDSGQEEQVLQDEEPERLGLPFAVRVALTLSNRQQVELITEIPAKDADRLYRERDLRPGGR